MLLNKCANLQIFGYADYKNSMGINKDNLIIKLTLQFALDIITFNEKLESQKKYNLANNYSEVDLLLAHMLGKPKVQKVK